ncbi:MAG: hypothetical protein JSV12_04230 [Candidatus Bathyarchaeota archaeon]|nr:MAG: hypothetical protein JSV12_04230 [Candidatus Bathyarchaeota archaeon]
MKVKAKTKNRKQADEKDKNIDKTREILDLFDEQLVSFQQTRKQLRALLSQLEEQMKTLAG